MGFTPCRLGHSTHMHAREGPSGDTGSERSLEPGGGRHQEPGGRWHRGLIPPGSGVLRAGVPAISAASLGYWYGCPSRPRGPDVHAAWPSPLPPGTPSTPRLIATLSRAHAQPEQGCGGWGGVLYLVAASPVSPPGCRATGSERWEWAGQGCPAVHCAGGTVGRAAVLSPPGGARAAHGSPCLLTRTTGPPCGHSEGSTVGGPLLPHRLHRQGPGTHQPQGTSPRVTCAVGR